MSPPLPVVALVCVALAFASFGCEGGGGNAASGGSAASAASPEQWSADVCNATVGLQNAVRQQSIKLQQELGKATSVAEARQSILEFLDASVMLQDHMLDQLQAAGYPDVEHGGVIAVDLRTELAKVKPALQDARKKAAALPDDPQTFARGAAEIESNLTIASANLGRRLDFTLGDYNSPELGRAMLDVPACRELGVIE